MTWVSAAFREARVVQERFRPFLTLCEPPAPSEIPAPSPERPLAGYVVSVKDNLCVAGMESRAGSRILKGYVPPFDATVVSRVKEAGAVILGKTSCDEFGFGSFNLNADEEFVPLNPADPVRVCGGSSGGSAAATAAIRAKHVALAVSTGGSIACPAAFCGVLGFCPTYGRVSRWGLISYADSLDKIGLMAGSVEELSLFFKVIAGRDERDETSLSAPVTLGEKKGRLKVGVVRESLEGIDEHVGRSVARVIDRLREWCDVDEVSCPLVMKYGVAAYYVLATSEASTNLARFCGLRYGVEGSVEGRSFNEYFAKIRSSSFREESKRRVILGTYCRMAGYRDAYYLRAARTRTLIINEYKGLFADHDVIVTPAMPVVAPTRSEAARLSPARSYALDRFTVGPNLAGLPHASAPVHEEGLPVGLLATTDHLQEGLLFQFLRLLRRVVGGGGEGGPRG